MRFNNKPNGYSISKAESDRLLSWRGGILTCQKQAKVARDKLRSHRCDEVQFCDPGCTRLTPVA